MAWLKRNKPIEIGKTWEPILDTHAYLTKYNPEKLGEIEEDSVFPFFFMLLEEPFKGWVIELKGIEEKGNNMSFVTVVDFIPPSVTKKEEDKLQKPLKKLMSSIVNDIMNNAINEAEKLVNDTRDREGNSTEPSI